MNSRHDSDSEPDFEALMFDERIERDPLFEEQQPFTASHVNPLLEKLVHLSRFGNLLTLVLGERGSGKTYLLERLLEAISEETDICFIQAQPLVTTDQVFQAIQSELLTTTNTALDNEAFQQYLSTQELPMVNRILVIDDADTLSTDVLRELCALSAAEQERDSPFLKVLLFANHDLTISIESAAMGVLPDTGIYTIDVPQLSERDARDWVESILLSEGYRAQPDEIFEIVEQGNYNLSQLQTLALEYTDMIPEDDFSDDMYEDEPGVSFMGYWFAGLTFVILLIFGGFFYQQEIAQLLFPAEPEVAVTEEVIDVSQPVVQATNKTEPALPEPTQQDLPDDKVQVTSQSELDEPQAELTAEPAVTEIAIDPVLPTAASATTPAESEAENLTPVSDAEPEPDLASTEPVLDNSTEELTSPAIEQSTITDPSVPDYSDSERLLLDAAETNYVVQIAGLSNPDSVRRLIAAHPEVNLLSYRSLLNGKPWQIVVAGPFENYAAASQERSQLPESLAVNKPWLKSIIKVKEEIETAVAK